MERHFETVGDVLGPHELVAPCLRSEVTFDRALVRDVLSHADLFVGLGKTCLSVTGEPSAEGVLEVGAAVQGWEELAASFRGHLGDLSGRRKVEK